MPHESGTSQTIEELQTRYQGLAEQKIKVETQRDSALKQLDELKIQARELFGSDDVGQLREKLKEMKESNELKRREYQQSLDKIDQDLAAVNEKFSDHKSE
ncbi:MAG: hypothetical protein ACI87E_000622 [Mariniblastus sp.]|jgi:hypothetical protein